MAKFGFSFFLVIHGLIHLPGFAKAFQFGNITQLTQEIYRLSGVAWLITCILLHVAALLYLTGNRYWWLAGERTNSLSGCLSLRNSTTLCVYRQDYSSWKRLWRSFQSEVITALLTEKHRLGGYVEAKYSYPDHDLVYGTFTLEKVIYNLKNI